MTDPLAPLRRALEEGRWRAAYYRLTVGHCPRWDLELDALAQALGAKRTLQEREVDYAQSLRTSRAGHAKTR